MNQKVKILNYLILVLLITPYVGASKTSHVETIYLGSGCFWGAEKGYELMDGVINAESGYANGYGIKPNYRSIIQFKNKYNEKNFAEVVKVTFNSNAISLENILKHFFETHDPTQHNRQGNDIGTQYRSAIFLVKDSHKDEVLKFKDELISEKVWDQPIVTQVEKIDVFYPAEDYHHNYYNNNKSQGYCQFVIQPKIEKYKKIFDK